MGRSLKCFNGIVCLLDIKPQGRRRKSIRYQAEQNLPSTCQRCSILIHANNPCVFTGSCLLDIKHQEDREGHYQGEIQVIRPQVEVIHFSRHTTIHVCMGLEA